MSLTRAAASRLLGVCGPANRGLAGLLQGPRQLKVDAAAEYMICMNPSAQVQLTVCASGHSGCTARGLGVVM